MINQPKGRYALILLLGFFVFYAFHRIPLSEYMTGGAQEYAPTTTLIPLSQPNNSTWQCRSSPISSDEQEWLTMLSFVEEEVLIPNNFKIVSDIKPVPMLDFIDKPVCSKVFDDWLMIANASSQYITPPRSFPTSMADRFLLNGHSKLIMRYSNDSPVPAHRVWNMIPSWLKLPEEELHTISAYKQEGFSVYNAFKHFQISGKKGFVIGSQTPWVEVYALLNGATEITTVEYQNTTIVGEERVRYIHPLKFAEQWKEFEESYDFAASFSSIEHSGLGRYGDPIDPIGDLREMWKTSCLLKPKGLFFLGLPRGRDTVVYNLHRIYGPLRLAMVMTGFQLLAVFRNQSPDPVCPRQSDFLLKEGESPTDLFVLRKM